MAGEPRAAARPAGGPRAGTPGDPGRGRRRGAQRGWLKMSARFLSRSLRLRAGSLILALVAITVGAAVAATMLNLEADLEAKMSRELRRYGPNLLLTPGGAAGPARAAVRAGSGAPGGDGSVPGTLDEAAVRSLGGPQPSPLLVAAGEVFGSDRSAPAAAAVVGADFAALRRLNPSWRVEGKWPEETGSATGDAGPAPGEAAACLVGAALARRADLAPGGSVTVGLSAAGLRDVRIAGVVSTGEAEDDQIFLPLALVQEATGLPGRLSLAAYAVDGGEEAVARAAARLEAALPGSEARPLRPIAAAQGAILGKLGRMMLLLTAVVLTLSALCLTTTLMGMVVERESEIGLLRSLGAGDADVRRIFLGEVSLLGLAGGAAGLLLGAAGARLIGARLFGAAVEARPSVAPLVFLIVLLVCWAAVLLPLRRALRIQPAAALRSE